MEDRIEELEQRCYDVAEAAGGNTADIVYLKEELKKLKEDIEAHNKALVTLTNTLHVVDAASLLAVYSLIKTDNLRQPDFKSKQDVIDSGCSDAITRMLKTVQVYMANEKEKSNGKDKTEGR